MVRRVASRCRHCDGEVPQRNMLTKRGYHPRCAELVMEANARAINAGEGPAAQRRLVKAIIEAQLQLRRLTVHRVDTERDGP